MKKHIALACILALTSCATMTTGQDQSVSVSTTPHSGARCTLKNDSGYWYVDSTPSPVTVKRDYSNLSITCTKGNLSGIKMVNSSTKAMAFGNILAGGLIGAAVDVGTGSAYDYPATIEVTLH